MKQTNLVFLILISLAACSRSALNSKPEPTLGEKFKIKYEQTVTLQNTGITIQFRRLLNDSRCPKGVECVWAGNAKIQIFLNGNPIELDTNPQFHDEAIVSGYKIKLISLTPYPGVKKQTKATDYIATLLITKAVK